MGRKSMESIKLKLAIAGDKKEKKRKTLLSTEMDLELLPSGILCDICAMLPNKSVIRINCTRNFRYARLADPQFVDLHFSREMENLLC